MAVERDRPYGGFHFQVTVGRRALDCIGVVLPRLLADPDVTAGRADAGDVANVAAVAPPHLVIRRGYCGSLDLYEWWHQERQPKRSRGRRVTVDLLDESRRPVTTWRFEGCRPVALEYSPLDAAASTLVIETITVTFDDVEMS